LRRDLRRRKRRERDEEGQVDKVISLSKRCLRELSRVQYEYPHGAPPYLYRTGLCLFRLLCNCVVWAVRCRRQGVTEEQGREGEEKGTRYDSRQN